MLNQPAGYPSSAGTTAYTVGSVALLAGTSGNVVGSVALIAGASANTLGAVAQAAGSTSVAPWYVISTAAAGAGSTTVDANLTSAGSTKLVGQVTVANPTTSVTVSNPSTAVDATLTSAGSTRLVGQVTVANPTTAVTVSSGVVLGAGSSANVLGAVAQAPGSTSIAPWYVISTAAAGAGSTTVDANLTSAGSTRVVGTVSLASAASTNSVAAFTVANPTTTVTVSSGVILAAGSSANVIGSVTLAAGTSANTVGSVALVAGTSANTIGSVAVVNPTTTVEANLSSAGSTRLVGVNNYESFTVASRTSVASSADIALFAASTAVRSRVISAISTGADLLVNLSTNVVSSASSGHDIRITAGGYFTMGGQTGNMPLYVGAVRVKVNSTAVNSVAVGLQFTT